MVVEKWAAFFYPLFHNLPERKEKIISLTHNPSTVNSKTSCLKSLTHSGEQAVRISTAPALEQVRQLLRLKGIGMNSAWLFAMEFFSWRGFHNRREVGSLAGLTPTPYQSGGSSHEQGISKAGNRRIRTMAVEIAWDWLRYQPDSQLSRWYQERFAKGGSRARRIGIVALARRLLVNLWQYLETGTLPEGACLKPS